MGSSPRVWGVDKYRMGDSVALRIIPTGVGSSNAVSLGECGFKDHPHGCGE